MTVAPEELRRRPVGVYDSGVGGLTVLHELLVRLPHEDYLYFADSARLPYGARAPEEVRGFALEVVEELLARRIKLLVVACNTATAVALPALRERLMETTLGVEVLGVVQPAAVQAVAATRSGKVGVLGTPATVASGAYASAIAAVDPFVEVVSVPCADLAMRIEAATIDDRLVEEVRGYCAPLRDAGVDTVILGCTHYPLVRPIIQRMLGPEAVIVTSGAPLARQVEHVLGTRGLDSPAGGEGRYGFLCTGAPAGFSEQGTRFLQLPWARSGRCAWARRSPYDRDRRRQPGGGGAPGGGAPPARRAPARERSGGRAPG